MENFDKYLKKTIYNEQGRLNPVFDDMTEYVERLSEIKEEIAGLIHEAEHLISDFARETGEKTVYERARSYWVAHIITALDKEHDYLGGSMTTMQDTIDDMDQTIDEMAEAGVGEEGEDFEEPLAPRRPGYIAPKSDDEEPIF